MHDQMTKADRVARQIDEMRDAAGKADALATVTETLFEDTDWMGGGFNARRVDHMRHLIVATREAADHVIISLDLFVAVLGSDS